MYRKKITLMCLILFFISCTQEKKQNKIDMEQLIKKEISLYKSFPNYSVQLDKGGCRVQLLGNEIPLYTVFEEGGFSALIPFNGNILKSGEQILKVRIYPDVNKNTFDEYTRLSVQIIYFENDKDPNSPRITLSEISIPKEVIHQKLNYYEMVIPFKAEVPFDFSKQLMSAKKISDLPNIETKVLQTYKKIYTWLENKDVSSLSDFRAEFNKKSCLAYYLDTDESIKEWSDYASLFEDDSKPDAFPKYKMVFYAGGKLVKLEKLDSPNEILTLTGKTGDGYEVKSELNVLLYMPEGSNELKQF